MKVCLSAYSPPSSSSTQPISMFGWGDRPWDRYPLVSGIQYHFTLFHTPLARDVLNAQVGQLDRLFRFRDDRCDL